MRAKNVKQQKPDSPGVGRWIKRYVALRTCRDIMRRAEQERLEVAEWEAERGITYP
jgi:hypothetical protein